MAERAASPAVTAAADFLSRLTDLLEQAEIAYMIAGSFASTYYGVPRTTHDIDIVVDPTFRSLKALLEFLPEDEYYVSEDTALDALKNRGQFNIIDLETGWKVDLIIRKSREFSAAEFGRRTPRRLLGLDVFVATAEDTVLAKLEWAQRSESERQLRDVAGVIRVSGAELDLEYMQGWVRRLGLSDEWNKALALADAEPQRS